MSRTDSPVTSPQAVVRAAEFLLEQCGTVVATLDDRAFTTPSETMAGGTIGKHVRHALDHYAALLDGLEGGSPVDYDHRERGGRDESDRAVTAERAGALAAKLGGLCDDTLGGPVTVRVMLSSGGDTADLASSVCRELAFATHHAIHHCAMIKAIAREHGVSTPDGFGTAPSTLNFEQGG